MNRKIENIVGKVLERPIIFFSGIAALAATVLFISASHYTSPEDFEDLKKNILGESFGLLFDLIIFGILLTIYQSNSEKKKEKETLLSRIDEFRHWKNEEAMIRIVGLIRRLNKLGVSNFRLLHCLLSDAKLANAKFGFSDFRWASCQNADFHNSNLHRIVCRDTNFQNTNFQNAVMTESRLFNCDFTNANLSNANLKDAWLINVNLQGANLSNTNLEGCKVFDSWEDDIQEWNIGGIEEISKKYEVTEEGLTATHVVSTKEEDRSVFECLYHELRLKPEYINQ